MKDLTVNDTHICKVPTKWKEISPDHIKALCKYINYAISPESLKVMMLLYISRLKLVRSKEIPAPGGLFDKTLFPIKGKKTGLFYASSADIAFMAESLDFLFVEKEKKKYMQSGLVENHFPRLRTRWRTQLYGPGSGLYNLTFAEFIRLETLYELITSKGSSEAENRFCGTLYRKRDKTVDPNSPTFEGDLREPFNDHLMDTYARQGLRLSRWKKNYIRLFYEGCRNFITDKFPQAFYANEAVETGTTTFENFNKLITGLSNSDLTKAKEIRKAPLYDALSQLEAFAIEGKKLREARDKKTVY